MSKWLLLKDVLLTGTGLAVILSQIFSTHPSDILLVAGLALTVPSAASHAKDVLTGPGGGSAGPSSPPPGSSQSPTSQD